MYKTHVHSPHTLVKGYQLWLGLLALLLLLLLLLWVLLWLLCLLRISLLCILRIILVPLGRRGHPLVLLCAHLRPSYCRHGHGADPWGLLLVCGRNHGCVRGRHVRDLSGVGATRGHRHLLDEDGARKRGQNRTVRIGSRCAHRDPFCEESTCGAEDRCTRRGRVPCKSCTVH